SMDRLRAPRVGVRGHLAGRGVRRAPEAGPARCAQRSQVCSMTLVNRHPYLRELGFFEIPLARALMVMGTSLTRVLWRRASTRTSELYWSCSSSSRRTVFAAVARDPLEPAVMRCP